METSEIMQSGAGLLLFIGVAIAILINCIFVWFALVLCRLRSNFSGMCVLSAAGILPSMFIAPSYAWACSLGLAAVLVRSVTDATDWLDSIKYTLASIAISLGLALLLLKLIFGTISISEIMKSQKFNQSQIQQQADVGQSGIDALRSQLSAEELAEIQRKVDEPLLISN